MEIQRTRYLTKTWIINIWLFVSTHKTWFYLKIMLMVSDFFVFLTTSLSMWWERIGLQTMRLFLYVTWLLRYVSRTPSPRLEKTSAWQRWRLCSQIELHLHHVLHNHVCQINMSEITQIVQIFAGLRGRSKRNNGAHGSRSRSVSRFPLLRLWELHKEQPDSCFPAFSWQWSFREENGG